MNCNIEIVKTFPVRKGGQTVCFANAGEIYSGTENDYGVVRFHVSDIEGKLYQVVLQKTDPEVKVTKFKNQTSV